MQLLLKYNNRKHSMSTSTAFSSLSLIVAAVTVGTTIY